VDGGVTSHNNPSLILYLMTILNAYRLGWKTGPANLTIVSIGTGTHRDRVVPDELGMGRTAKVVYRAVKSLMNDIKTFVLVQMQYLGECLTPWWINSELGSLAAEIPAGGKMFRFLRYDVRLELPWIEALRETVGKELFDKELGRELTEIDVVRMRSMDDPTIVEDIYKLARVAARQQVKPEHWVGEMPTWCNGQRPSAEILQLGPRAPGRSAESSCAESLSRALSHLRSLITVLRSRRRD
jgi:uncharacterized protein